MFRARAASDSPYSTRVVDPVCGMELDASTVTVRLALPGREECFCRKHVSGGTSWRRSSTGVALDADRRQRPPPPAACRVTRRGGVQREDEEHRALGAG